MDGDYQYIKKARLWLDEIIKNGDAMSRYTKQYDKRLTQIINQYEGDGKLLI